MAKEAIEILVLYDGHCALCNGFVKIIIKLDRKKQFHFAALKSSIGKAYLGLNQIDEAQDSIVLIYKKKVFQYDNAAFKIAQILGFPANLICIGKILPKTTTRKMYNWVAAHRYRWFGKYDVCPIPSAENKDRFL
jgi:predicted DCC family thiol-disulfide oxidoreductase YuxK